MFIIEGKAGSGVSKEVVELLNNFKGNLNVHVLIIDESSEPYSGLESEVVVRFLELDESGISNKELKEIIEDQFNIVAINNSVIDMETIKSLDLKNTTTIVKRQLPM